VQSSIVTVIPHERVEGIAFVPRMLRSAKSAFTRIFDAL
jgi:hypothetical protein